MRVRTRRLSIAVVALAGVLGIMAGSVSGQGTTKIRYALGDVVGIDDLPLLIAAERAKARGVEVEITPFKSEEIATQAVINGQADVGQGTPYAALQKVNVPIRFFYQLSTLQFFPIVAKEQYKTWKDLDGQEIAVQGRGSGTEAIMVLAAKQHGIKYKSISYVPGSQVRGLAMLKGTIKASILDGPNTKFVMKEAPDKFLVLPLGELKASDEALFATHRLPGEEPGRGRRAAGGAAEGDARDQREPELRRRGAQAARAPEGPSGEAGGRGAALLPGRRPGRHLPGGRRRRRAPPPTTSSSSPWPARSRATA